MQFTVQAGTVVPFDLAADFEDGSPVAYGLDQNPPIVPEKAYDAAFGTTTNLPDYARIQDNYLDWLGLASPVPLQPKAIQELFDTDYGRMNATLGAELPYTNITTQTTIPLMYIDPPTEILLPSAAGAPLESPLRRHPALEGHAQRGGHPLHPLPPVRRAARQPGRLGRRDQAA